MNNLLEPIYVKSTGLLRSILSSDNSPNIFNISTFIMLFFKPLRFTQREGFLIVNLCFLFHVFFFALRSRTLGTHFATDTDIESNR